MLLESINFHKTKLTTKWLLAICCMVLFGWRYKCTLYNCTSNWINKNGSGNVWRKKKKGRITKKASTSLKINRIIVFITQKITNAIPLAMAQAYYGLPATRAYFVSLVTAICTYTNRTHAHTHSNTHSICN